MMTSVMMQVMQYTAAQSTPLTLPHATSQIPTVCLLAVDSHSCVEEMLAQQAVTSTHYVNK